MSRMIDDEEELKDYGLIEVDGCNVAECEFFDNKEDECLIRGYGKKHIMMFNCKHNPNCYFKQLQRVKAELEMTKQYADMLKANRCHHNVLSECSQEHHSNCVGKKQCILDLEQIITNLKAENEKQHITIEKLKGELYIAEDSLRDYQEHYNKLEAENEKLKQALIGIKVDFINHNARNGITKFENEIFLKINEVLKD